MRAEPANQMRRIGVLTGFPPKNAVGESVLTAFRQELSARGWVEGRNIAFDVRWGGGSVERLRGHAAELARMTPDVIVVHGSRALTAVRQETDRIPIIFASVSDPVASGYVKSLARPGGNVTGITVYSGTPSPKLLEWLKQIAPNIARVAFVITPSNLGLGPQLKALETFAPSFAVKTAAMLIRDPATIEQTIADFAQEPNGSLIVTSDVVMIAYREAIITAAARHRLPAVYQDRSFAEAGGLLSYSVDRRENYRRAAIYVDRILKGAKPAELPVQQPGRFEAVLNVKTAKALGLQVPRHVLARVDVVLD
jgi:putative ABC transport system substrate-binding protein